LLFSTELWERFSYYGMRAVLVLYLTDLTANGGMGWTQADALKLYGIYTGLVYITPIIGGWLGRYLPGPAPCHPVRCRADGRRPIYPGTASRHVP
jgi:dipeptide/tripeptide permease